jgi:hypothetical protein
VRFGDGRVRPAQVPLPVGPDGGGQHGGEAAVESSGTRDLGKGDAEQLLCGG